MNECSERPASPAKKSTTQLYQIGEISRIYSITPRTVRFYEEMGLLKPIRRGGSRFYDSTQAVRLQLILKGKRLGFTLTEIAEFLKANSGCAGTDIELALDEKLVLSQLGQLEKRRSELDQAIEELRATRARLEANNSAGPLENSTE